jgi:hypothetical protein
MRLAKWGGKALGWDESKMAADFKKYVNETRQRREKRTGKAMNQPSTPLAADIGNIETVQDQKTGSSRGFYHHDYIRDR